MPRTALAERFAEHVAARGLLRPGQHVLVALSGGLDSLVLLHLLRFELPDLRLRITAAHFDHAMRTGSAADAHWVRGLCRAWDVPLVSARAVVPLRGESAARAARYAFLHDAAATVHARRILTAHQRDDQAETVLFRLARGTGLAGLAGIPERRGLLVRPLLPFPRSTLAEYARVQRLRPREDPTNRSLEYARNRLRHVLLPALERDRPGARARLARIAELAGHAQAAWRGLLPALAAAAAQADSPGRAVLARVVLLDYDPRSRARVLRHWAERLEAPLSRRGTAAALELVGGAQSGRGITLAGGLRIRREFDRIILDRPARDAQRPGDRPLSIAAADAAEARVRLGGIGYEVAWEPAAGDESDARNGQAALLQGAGPGPLAGGAPWSARFDATALAFPLELRGWRPGDRIVLDYGAKKLKKLFAERRIGRSARASVPVLAEQGPGGRVLWVAGVAHAACARARVGRPAWHITVRHEREG